MQRLHIGRSNPNGNTTEGKLLTPQKTLRQVQSPHPSLAR